MRENIKLEATVIDLMVAMSEGNPGAINVLANIIKTNPNSGLITMLSLDDMNIRGSQIWLGYKDHCGQNIDKFIECVDNRDVEMVNTINKHSGMNEVAVVDGASFTRRKNCY